MENRDLMEIASCELSEIEQLCSEHPEVLLKKDKNDRYLIHWAAVQGRELLVEYLIDQPGAQKHLIDAVDDIEATPLVLATLKGNLEIVKSLIAHGANINHRTFQGHSPLQYACSKGWKDIAFYYMKCSGVDINIRDKRGDTPLHRLVSLGRTVILTEYLKLQPQLDLQNAEGNSPLHIACEDDQDTCAIMLLDRGADITLENRDKKTPLDLCNPRLRRKLKDRLNME